jgi:hypothetical protein
MRKIVSISATMHLSGKKALEADKKLRHLV